jgi:hypothetical protein
MFDLGAFLVRDRGHRQSQPIKLPKTRSHDRDHFPKSIRGKVASGNSPVLLRPKLSLCPLNMMKFRLFALDQIARVAPIERIQ